jgi:hypothetical protein
MIHSASKMLHEEKRRAALLSEPAVGEANPVGFNELRRGRDVSVYHASFFPFDPRAPTRVSPGAVVGETLLLSYGSAVLAIAILCCEDKNPSKTEAQNTNVGETSAMLPQELRRDRRFFL